MNDFNGDLFNKVKHDTDMFIELIAKVAHEVNRGYCQSLGDNSQPKWEDIPDWQKDSAIDGVMFHMGNNATPEESHQSWLNHKIEDGWKWGPVKDPVKKEHPCLVLYSDLPREQKTKDYLFKSVVESFK